MTSGDPVAVLPVKETLRIFGCAEILDPRSLASAMTFKTPGGRASLMSSARRRVESGVVGAGFLPASFSFCASCQ